MQKINDEPITVQKQVTFHAETPIRNRCKEGVFSRHGKASPSISRFINPRSRLYVIILVYERDIPNTTAIIRHELTVTRRPLILRVSCQHTLDAHADALDCLHGGPAGGAEQIEADDAVAVDVGVHWDRAGSVG